MDEFSKQPLEIFNITINFSNVLDSGETISSYTIVVAESGLNVSTDIIDSSSNTTSTVAMKVKNGDNGKNYYISTLVTTSASNKYEHDVKMVVSNA